MACNNNLIFKAETILSNIKSRSTLSLTLTGDGSDPYILIPRQNM